jgi:hypothetical protein
MPCVRKREQLVFKLGKQGACLGKNTCPLSNLLDWIDMRVTLSCSGLTAMAGSPAFCSSAMSAVPTPRVLDQDPMCFVGLRMRNGARLERGIIEATAQYIQHIILVLVNKQRNAHGTRTSDSLLRFWRQDPSFG